MKRRYSTEPPLASTGRWPVVDGCTGAETFQCASQDEALRRATTLNDAYEAFLEGTAAWRDTGRPRVTAA